MIMALFYTLPKKFQIIFYFYSINHKIDLFNLNPVFDTDIKCIRVGGRLKMLRSIMVQNIP